VIETWPDAFATCELQELVRPVGITREPRGLANEFVVLDGEKNCAVEAERLAELAHRAVSEFAHVDYGPESAQCLP
jgi:hypothetical protein